MRCHRNSQRLRRETVSLAADTTFGSDVTIEPFVVISPGVSIADGAVIHSFSHMVQASIGKKAQNNREGGAARYRAMKMRAKAAKKD